ncbi:mlr7403 protein [Vibrio ishigakensis]|nr:mlr7403 protein [Vibrio ishigakensis]
MELYDSEEQQVEAIKDWWQENGKAVILGAVIGLGGLFGWRYYQDSVVEGQEAASVAYNSAVQTLQTQGVAAADQVQSFIDSNSDREYAVLAAMQLAQVQVAEANYAEALKQLEWAKANTKDTAIAPV